MITIYHAANSLDANMIKGLLAQHDIRAFVQGAYLQGAVGELPATGLVTVSVDDENQIQAKKIINEWESAAIIEDETQPSPLGDGLNVTS